MPELVPPVNAMFLFGFPPVETVYGTSSAGEEAKELYSLEEGNPDITEQKGEWHSVEVLKNRSKGLGLVATKDICRGKEILTEKAMITMTPTTANLAMHPPRNHPLLGDAELAREIRAMSPSIQELFYSLSKGPSRNPETLGRILINSLPIDNNQWAIFPQLSRINNSCYANCHWSWNAETKKGQLFCVRKVLVGEELTIAYISHGGTNRYRREKLWRNYGFDCQCDFCVLTGMDFIASDNRQVEIQEICRRIHPRDERMETDPKAAIRDIYELLKLYDGEDIVDARLTDALRRAFDIHVMHGDQGRARFFVERAWECMMFCYGVDHPLTKKMEGLRSDPKTSEYWGMSELWKTGRSSQPEKYWRSQMLEGDMDFEQWLWLRTGMDDPESLAPGNTDTVGMTI